jgi:hypothetical protein
MILVVVATWNTTHLLIGVVDLGGVLLPIPGDMVLPDARSRVETIRDAQQLKPIACVVKFGTQRRR